MEKLNTGYVYEMQNEDAILTPEEEKIINAMRKVNTLWKKYKANSCGNRLILFCGGCGCDVRFETPSRDNVLENFEHITCDGGDGGDSF